MDPGTFERKAYNLSKNPNALPGKLLHTVCSELYVEFLKTTTGQQSVDEKKQAANHAAFNIVFANEWETHHGMRPEVCFKNKYESETSFIDGRQVVFEWGDLTVKPTSSSGPSRSSLWTCSLPINPNWTVGDVIELLFETQASSFQFVEINKAYFGCRDFITQVIYLMKENGFIKSTDYDKVLTGPALPVRSIYEALGFRFDHLGGISACPIDKGRFPLWKKRFQSDSMPYQDSRKALELADLIAP